MVDNVVLGRTIKITPSVGQVRCDFCHRIISLGRPATQVTQGIAQGVFHGPRCYEAARQHYEELKKKFVPPKEE